MDTLTRPDERAAGVISGTDPYREMELYLEKVSEELGVVFDQWKNPVKGGVPPVVTRPPPAPAKNNLRQPQEQAPQVQGCKSRHRKARVVNSLNIFEEFNNIITEITHRSPVEIHGEEVTAEERGEDEVDEAEEAREEGPMRYKQLVAKEGPAEGAGQPLLIRVGPLETPPPPPPPPAHLLSHVTLRDLDESEDSGLERSAEILDSPLADRPPSNRDRVVGREECGTQTSPPVSRSSSFTWLSDSSSLRGHSPPDSLGDEDDSSSTSSGEDRQPQRSQSDCNNDDPESGIGTSSPPNNRSSKGIAGCGQKCRRKETWERLRRRQSGGGGKHQPVGWSDEVWVRRESMPKREGGECSSDPEVCVGVAGAGGGVSGVGGGACTAPRRPRPNCLPLAAAASATTSLAAVAASAASPLASPSSLKHSAPPLPPELTNKSSSAPLLANSGHPLTRSASASSAVLKQPRSQSERHLTEIEAGEACKWLRAAGFPQYAQMYEDLQFPIDVSAVQKDHPFLDPDSLQSLFRRLQVLNRCASMKVDNLPKPTADDSDEDDQCALSENWTFQPESRRWSRVCDVTSQRLQIPPGSESVTPESSETPVIRYGSLPPGALTPDSELLAARFRRSNSERLRDGAKAILRRVESLKSKRKKRQNREGIVISGPQVLDIVTMEQRMKDLNCVDVSPPPSPLTGTETRNSRRLLSRPDSDSGALSDSELPWRQHYFKDANSNHTKVLEILDVGGKGVSGSQGRERLSPASRSGSLSTTPEGYPSRTRVHKRTDIFRENEAESTKSSSGGPDSDTDTTPKHKGGTSIVKWHSFQRASVRPDSYVGHSVCSLSSGQMLVLKKVALLKLTSIMERYCPTHRTGWNWELPKFMRKIKTPDYKDKTVFGVPLVISLQRTGQSLPTCIQTALTWLRKNALDQLGLFRKPGVRSRIQNLKTTAEAQPEDMSYEGQQAYDVADMVKQYFRELPEALLTNKLSETFVAIFQHVPVNQRTEAMQCALLLLPDEHREALVLLLQFLSEVCAHAPTNQMTASNLAVCLAPSLFHWHPSPSRSASVSPRRKQRGTPDPRELGQTKAAHECLLALIKNHRELFTVCEELLGQCHFSFMDESIPVALEELGSEMQQDWKGYMETCMEALLKEAREKTRGWVSVSAWMGVDMSYKKVGDGHPLRLWKVSTEVEAPPTELLRRVLRERQLWDVSLLKWRVVTNLEPSVEVFQYVTASMPPLPAKDYCVLRSWKTELPKGACVIVETSVEHAEGQVLSGGVRGIVLASRYLIEPCGSGRSRIMHLSRVDTKGRTPEWYNKSYGHLCALHLAKIRSSFKHTAEGPESKV